MSNPNLPEMPPYIASVHSPTLNKAVEAYALQAVEADRNNRPATDLERELAATLQKVLGALAEVLPFCDQLITPRVSGVALNAQIAAVQTLAKFDKKAKP